MGEKLCRSFCRDLYSLRGAICQCPLRGNGWGEFGNRQCNKRETRLSCTLWRHFQFILKISWSQARVSKMGSELVISGQMPASGESFTKGVRVHIWTCFTLSLLQTECCSGLRNFPIWGFGLESSLLWAINIFKIPENFLPGHLEGISLFGMKARQCSVGVLPAPLPFLVSVSQKYYCLQFYTKIPLKKEKTLPFFSLFCDL